MPEDFSSYGTAAVEDFASYGTPANDDYNSPGVPDDLSEREKKRLELMSEMAAARGEANAQERRQRFIEPAQNLVEGALAGLSLSPSAVAQTLERGIPATAAVVRGEKAFTPAPPVVSGFLNPGEDRAIKIPDIPTAKDTPVVGQIAAGLGNAVIGFANIFTTPEGVFSLGLGGLPKETQKQVIGVMAANMAAHYPQEFGEAMEAAKAGDYATATKKIVGTPVMASVMGRASIDMPKVPKAPEFPGLPDADLVARNQAAPGTLRPQEQQLWAQPEIPAPEMFQAGEVPFSALPRFGTFKVPEPVIMEPFMQPKPGVPVPQPPKVQAETRGKVSFGAEAPTLLRTAIEQGEQVGLTRSVEALKTTDKRAVQDVRAETVAKEPAAPVAEPVSIADQVAAMPAAEFPAWAKAQEGGFTTTAYKVGETMRTPEGVAKLKALEESARAEEAANFAKAKAGDMAALESMSSLSGKKQFLTEALESAVGVAKNKSNLTAEQVAKAKAAGVPAETLAPEPTKAVEPVGAQSTGALPETAGAGRGELGTAPASAALPKPAVDWELLYEDLVGDLDSFNPARNSGKRNYELDDMASRFVDYAKADNSGRPLGDLVKDFAKQDEASPSQIRKLKASVKSISTPDVPPPTEGGIISGSKAEKWADDVLNRDPRIGKKGGQTNMLLDPAAEAKRLAAIAIKGAAVIERGVKDFAKWSEEMVRIHGPEIRDSLKDIYARSNAYIQDEIKRASQPKPTSTGAPAAPASAPSAAPGAAAPSASPAPTPSSPTPRPAPTTPPPAARPPGTPPARVTLDDIYQIFETPPKPGVPVKERVVKAVESFRTGLSSQFRPLNKLAEDIAKSTGARNPKDVAGIFEQLKGSSGKAEADVYRFDQDVSKTVKGMEQDFNAYLFLRRSLDRLNQDAADAAAGLPVRRKVSSYTIPDLEAKLAALESKVGPAGLAKFQTAADNFQNHMDTALKLQVDSGRMSPEVYDAIKDGNQFYAPFKVMKYIEESIKPEGAGRRVDTAADYVKAMEGIESPDFKLGDMLAAARQNITMSRILAEKNRAMQNITDLHGLDTRGMFVKKLRPDQDAPKGMDAVNVMEGGEKVRYAVDQTVADAVKMSGNEAGYLLARMASNTFRVGATSLNLPFQVSNLLADTPRAALVSKYGINGVADLVSYPLDFMQSIYSSITGEFGRKNQLYLDYLDSGAAGTTVQKYLTPEALRFNPESGSTTLGGIAKSVLGTVPKLADAIEQTNKILGIKRAMRFEGVNSGAELARRIPDAVTEVRRFSGSPDFGRMGKWVDQYRLNLLYMFLNARIQGTVADLGRLTGRDGRAQAGKTWFKVGSMVALPTAYLYMLNNSEKYKADYDSRPEQEKRNYWLIPKDSYIKGSNGEQIRDYWRIPKREISQWVANATESGLDFASQKDPDSFWKWAAGMAESVAPVNMQGKTAQERLESIGAGLNPLVKGPLEIATGRDLYRHKDIVPDTMKKASPEQQYTDRTAEVFKQLAEKMPDAAPEMMRSPLMLEKALQDFTAGLVTQFVPRKPVEGRSKLENNPLLQRFQAVPFTDSTKFDEQVENYQREAADTQLARFRAAQKFMDEHKGAAPDRIMEDLRLKHGGDRKMVERVVDLFVAERAGVSSQDRRILNLPVEQRAQFVMKELESASPEKKAQLLKAYSAKRILTKSVAEEMVKLGFRK